MGTLAILLAGVLISTVSDEVLIAFIAVGGVIVTGVLSTLTAVLVASKTFRENERVLQEERAYIRREKRYAGLIDALPGFLMNST